MKHKQYILKVKNTIYETGGGVDVTYLKKGKTLNVDSDTFDKIKKGKTITDSKIAGHGLVTFISYDKSNFENEVDVLVVETTFEKAKLGKRK